MGRTVFLGLLPALLITACNGGQDCQPEDHTTCVGGELFWVDSCGEVGYRIKVCECGCDDATTGCEFPCPECSQNADCSDQGPNHYCDLESGECRCAPLCEGKCCGDDGCGAVCPDICGVGAICEPDVCECVPEEVCSDGQTRCDSDVLLVCVDNDWSVQENCVASFQACQDGACVCVPTGEETCNGLDDDCDGETDEYPALLLAAEAGVEASDGLDNNCNGLVDEPGGVMVEIADLAGRRAWIDVYEATVFENPDCTGPRYGADSDDYPAEWPADAPNQIDLYACSLPGLVPSGALSRWRAMRACQAQGKRLCLRSEFILACASEGSIYPWGGVVLPPGVCNDPWTGQGSAASTGSHEQCTGEGHTYDMIGNLAEWIADDHPVDPSMGQVAGWSYSLMICFLFGDVCRLADVNSAAENQVLTYLADCVPGDADFDGFPPTMAWQEFGVRCCLDGP